MTAVGDLAIYVAMTQHLEGATNAERIVHENRRYDPTEGTPYWQCKLMPATPFAAAMGSAAGDWRLGYLSILLHYPPHKGPGPAALGAANIAERFAKGTSLTGGNTVVIKITDPVEVRPSQPGADWFVLPVRVHYKAFDP